MKKSNKTLEIIATSDIHGAFYPIDLVKENNNSPSIAHLSTYVKEQRNIGDREIILLDNGDFLQGDPLTYYYNYIDTNKPHIASESFNYLKYDAICIGNHDLEGGKNVFDRVNNELNNNIICCNIVDKNNKPHFTPYKIFHKCNNKIAVLGISTPGSSWWIPDNFIEGLFFIDMIEAADKWIKFIKEVENPDMIIGLFHSGTDYTYNEQDINSKCNENATTLVAHNVDGFDIIICGHDHKGHNFTLTNKFGNNVLIIAPTSKMKDFCSIEVSFNSNKLNISGKIYYTLSLDTDEDYVKKLQPLFVKASGFFNKPIGYLTNSISKVESLFKPSEYISFIHEIQLKYTNADISFAAPLSLGVEINKGIQYKKDLFKFYNFDNYFYVVELTGEEILKILEFSHWGWFNLMKNKDDYLLRYKLDENGDIDSKFFPKTHVQYYNYESAYGINYSVDVSKPYGERVKIYSYKNNKEFNLNNKYKVVINSFRYSGGGNHFKQGANLSKEDLNKRIVFKSEKEAKHYFKEYFKDTKELFISTVNNWHIEPKEWFNNRYLTELNYYNS
ncbi:MAG: bifunctional metallophosphatase/5'-nucleotidase [Bacteroidales bacterium]